MTMLNDLTSHLVLALISVLFFTILYFKYAYSYWSRRKVPFLPPKFPLGNLNTAVAKGISIGTPTKEFYQDLKKQGHKVGGIFTVLQPHLVIIDPDYVKDILTSDFQYFADRGIYFNEKTDPLNANLFSHNSEKWKKLRVKFTPTFTSGKMKMMFHNVVDSSKHLIEELQKYVDRKEDIDIYEIAGCFTTDVIGKSAFGIDCNSFKYPDAEFRVMGKKVFQPPSWFVYILFITNYMPNLARKLGLSQSTNELQEFFDRITKENVQYREKNKIVRPDFLQLLIDLKNDSINDEQNLTMKEIVGQCTLFFVAGYETSSTTIQYCIHELAQNQQVQERARQEVNEVLKKYNGEITYDAIMEMKYLSQCVDETLRLYPPVPTLNRRCVKDYKLKNSNIVIEKGTSILIPALGIHHDPEYYPNPLKWDPERFNDVNKSQRHSSVFLPFGDGPRNCIGLRFGVMQVKIGLAQILRNFRVTVSPKTVLPLKYDPTTFLLFTTKKIYVKLENISNS